jgi:hypothetical protein
MAVFHGGSIFSSSSCMRLHLQDLIHLAPLRCCALDVHMGEEAREALPSASDILCGLLALGSQ